jgi:hypothetical protein
MHRARTIARGLEMKTVTAACCAVGFLVAGLISLGAAPASPEDRYVASREAAIKKLKPLYDAGKMDDAGTKTEDAARADLEAQLHVILGPLAYAGFGPGKLNLDSLYEGDEGFGMLDGLLFDDKTGKNGEPAGSKPDGSYVEPRAHIIVTTQTLFAGWLRAHKDWWDKSVKNVPQQIGAALKDESFYTQAISTDAAVINFNELPIAKPGAATLVYAMLAGRTQSEVPDEADEVFVSALGNGKVYVAYGSIEPKVRIPACEAIRAGFNQRSSDTFDAFREKRIDKKAYDKLGNLRQQGEDAFKRCFTARAPKEPAFAAATQQAQALLDKAVGK